MSAHANTNNCICCSGKPAEGCCERFLKQGQNAKTPEQLMRSRYSAFALGGFGGYLLRTWFPPTAPQSTELELSQRNQNWTGLEVLSKSQSGDDGTVEFKAHYMSVDGEACALHEKSVFKRLGNRWLYIGGEITSD